MPVLSVVDLVLGRVRQLFEHIHDARAATAQRATTSTNSEHGTATASARTAKRHKHVTTPKPKTRQASTHQPPPHPPPLLLSSHHHPPTKPTQHHHPRPASHSSRRNPLAERPEYLSGTTPPSTAQSLLVLVSPTEFQAAFHFTCPVPSMGLQQQPSGSTWRLFPAICHIGKYQMDPNHHLAWQRSLTDCCGSHDAFADPHESALVARACESGSSCKLDREPCQRPIIQSLAFSAAQVVKRIEPIFTTTPRTKLRQSIFPATVVSPYTSTSCSTHE